MLLYFYSVFPLLFLPIDSSSIRDRNFKNDLVPSVGSRLDPFKKDANSLKVVSSDPFIIQLQMPNGGENAKKGGKEKDMKSKSPMKKRGSKTKYLRKRLRRDLQSTKTEIDKERKPNLPGTPQAVKVTEYESHNDTKNAVSRGDILKALSSYSKKRESKKSKKNIQNSQERQENGSKTAKHDGNIQELPPSDRAPLVKMVYPTSPKPDKHSHKYTYKDLMADRERLEKKIRYIRNMLNVSAADDLIRVRRRSESDRTANKIAKMFLTLSAVNGLHDRLKSKCDDEDDEEGYRVQDVWEKERQDSPSRKSSSSNEERYKVKKWIEHMKSKRTSSKTCPCMPGERDEENDAFPLEQKLPKNYYLLQRGGSSEESSEAFRDPSRLRDRTTKNSHYRRRNHKARDDHENKLKALAGRGNKKLELPLDDLEVYRSKAKQILQNAEEILDKIKEEEEKRLAAPNILMSQLKELTAKIQADPRNKENDLIRKIQKNLGRGLTPKSSEGTDGTSFLENVKSFILDPYEKAKALTDESTKKLSSYLLRNLGELQESNEMKEDEDKGDLKVYFEQVPQKEDEKPSSANLAREKPEYNLSKSKEDFQNWTEAVSSVPGGDVKKLELDPSGFQEEQFKKRMQEMIKEQEKKLNEYEVPAESEESSNELAQTVGNEKENQKEITQSTPKEDEVAAPKNENVGDPHTNENVEKENETAEGDAPKESAFVSKTEVPEIEDGNEETASKHLKEEEVEREVLEEIMKEIQREEENAESESKPEHVESSIKEGENKLNDLGEEIAPGETHDGEKVHEIVAATAEEETSLSGASNVDPQSESDQDVLSSMHYITEGSDQSPLHQTDNDEKTEAKAEEPKEDESNTDKEEDLEMASHPENVFESGVIEPLMYIMDMSDEQVNGGDELQETADPLEMTQEKVKAEKDMESADLIQEPNPEFPSEKIGEEKGEENEKEENLQLGNPAGERESEKENLDEKISEDDHVSKSAVTSEEKVSGAFEDEENLKEGSDEKEREVLRNEGPESNFTDETPLVSANADDQKRENSKELNEEISLGQFPSEGEALQRMEKPTEDLVEDDGTILKDTNSENEDIQYSSDDNTTLKATLNSQTEEDGDPNVDNETTGVTAGSLEEIDEKAENLDGSNENLLESTLDKGQEEADKDSTETNLKAASDPSQSDENGETQSIHEVDDETLKLAKSTADDEKELDSLKETGSGEVVEEKQNEENMDEENDRVEAADPTGRSNQETETLNDSGEDDGITQEGNLKEEPYTEEGKDVVLKTLDDGDSESLKDKTEEDGLGNSGQISSQGGTMNGEETLKAVSRNQDQEDFNEGDDGETLQAARSNEEPEMTQENFDNDENENLEATLRSRDHENEGDEETPLKATNNEEAVTDGLRTNEENDDAPLKVALADENQETMEDVDDETLQKEASIDVGDTKGSDDDATLKATLNKEDEKSFEDAVEASLRAENSEDMMNNGEAEENIGEGDVDDDPSLRANIKEDDEEIPETDETPLRAVNINEESEEKEETNVIREGEEETPDMGESETSLRAENPVNTYQEPEALETDNSDETSLRAASFEELSNNINDGDETPLRTAMGSSEADSVKDVSTLKDNSEERLRASNIPHDFSNQIDDENEDETFIKSANPLDDTQKETESSFETVKEENPSVYSEESEGSALDPESDSSLVAANLPHQTKYQDNPEEVSSDNLQKLHPRTKPLKAGKLKVPTSIAKIMKDLGGKEKDDISSIDNLNPEKIDDIIDKIGEAEEQNKVTDEVDCRKECACADDIDMRSRNIGRYEIVKDFLHWMKDLQLNRVLSDD